MTKHPNDLDVAAEAERAVYLEHRKHLLELGYGQIALADKSVLYIGSGAIGLSIAFIDKLQGSEPTEHPILLGSAWICLVLSVILSFLSHHTSWKDAMSEIKRLDESYSSGNGLHYGGNLFRTVTDWLNDLSAIALVLGVSLLLIFAFVNISQT